MDKSQYINESIRTAMLKQEKIFREQVHELHRLYRVQKLLMAESNDKYAKWHKISDATMKVLADSSARLQSSFSTFGTSHSSHYSNTRLDLISQELNISFKDKRVQKGLNCCSDGENDVDLTLSIGRGADQKKTKHKLN